MKDAEVLLVQTLKIKRTDLTVALAKMNDYKKIKVPKKRGGFRTIYIPPSSLKIIQRLILRKLFYHLHTWKPPEICGLYRGTLFFTNAWLHRNNRWVFQLDLADAFPSASVELLRKIIEDKVNRELCQLFRDELEVRGPASVFQRTRWGNNLSEQFTFPSFCQEFPNLHKEITDLIMRLTTFRGLVPQGTPTAPFLFYLVLVDRLWSDFSSVFPWFPEKQDKFQFAKSVYVDGFVASAQKPIPEENRRAAIKAVESAGFKVNPQKVSHRDVRQGNVLITGLRVIHRRDGQNYVVFPKRKIRKWRGLIHRAIYEPELRPKALGIVAGLRPIYHSADFPPDLDLPSEIAPYTPPFPSQLKKPYKQLLQQIQKEKENARP